MRSYSCCDSNEIGHVDLNGDRVWAGAWRNDAYPSYRGTYIMLVDPVTCTVQGEIQSAKYGDLVSYIEGLSDGAIVVGVTANEPTMYLPDTLIATLDELGVSADGLEYRGTFGFVAQKGSPEKTVQRKVASAAESLSNPAQFVADLSGCIFIMM